MGSKLKLKIFDYARRRQGRSSKVYRWGGDKSNDRVVDLNPMISIIRFYAKRLNIPIKGKIVMTEFKKLCQACAHCL